MISIQCLQTGYAHGQEFPKLFAYFGMYSKYENYMENPWPWACSSQYQLWSNTENTLTHHSISPHLPWCACMCWGGFMYSIVFSLITSGPYIYITLPVNVRYPTRPAVSTSTCRLGRVVHICIINTRWNTQWACRSWIMYMILWYHPGVILTISQGEYQDDGSYSTHLVRVRCITSNRSHEFSVLFPHFTKCKGNVA